MSTPIQVALFAAFVLPASLLANVVILYVLDLYDPERYDE